MRQIPVLLAPPPLLTAAVGAPPMDPGLAWARHTRCLPTCCRGTPLLILARGSLKGTGLVMRGNGKIACDYIFPSGSRQQVYRKFDMPFSRPSFDGLLPGRDSYLFDGLSSAAEH